MPDGSAFPATHGQATSFFQTSDVQQEFAFIPDNGSKTYVINVETNSTQALAGPTTKDAKATYAASITALVQLDSTGAVTFLPYKQGDASTNTNAAWSKVANLAAASPPGSGTSATPSGSSSASGSGSGSHAPVPTKSGSPAGNTGNNQSAGGSSGTSGASTSSGTAKLAIVAAGVMGTFAALL